MLVDKKTETIRGMIAQRLKAVAAAELSNVPVQPHLDEDMIAAFVEGRLQDNECQPVLAHLAACSACRRASAQMVQLENQVDADVSAGSVDEEPGRLESLLSKFGSLVPTAGEDVVFAYQNPEEEQKATSVPSTSESRIDSSDES
jgi:anti-sigma factor ChrR (cupin superfamily)